MSGCAKCGADLSIVRTCPACGRGERVEIVAKLISLALILIAASIAIAFRDFAALRWLCTGFLIAWVPLCIAIYRMRP